jgi:hypothetical protein
VFSVACSFFLAPLWLSDCATTVLAVILAGSWCKGAAVVRVYRNIVDQGAFFELLIFLLCGCFELLLGAINCVFHGVCCAAL